MTRRHVRILALDGGATAAMAEVTAQVIRDHGGTNEVLTEKDVYSQIYIFDECVYETDQVRQAINDFLKKIPVQTCAPESQQPTFKGKRIAKWKLDKNQHLRYRR